MNNCWVAGLGDCSDKISKEHTFTAGMFLSDSIFVQGLPWCKDETREVGLASLTKKILCTRHNSDLSVVDNVAIQAFNIFRQVTELSNQRLELKIKHPRVIRCHIDGLGLERWFLKTLINVAYQQSYPVWDDTAPRWQPPLHLVEIAFGRRDFEPRAGLYATGSAGDSIVSEDRINVITFTNESDQLVGAHFSFRGFGFILYMEQTGLNDHITMSNRVPGGLRYLEPHYHQRKIRLMIGKSLSHVIEINWPANDRR